MSGTTPPVVAVRARNNPLLVQVRRLAQDGSAYRRLGLVWIEGEHLCRAASEAGPVALHAIVDERAWGEASLRELASTARRVTLVSPDLLAGLSTLESPARIGFVLALATSPQMDPSAASLVLDRVQDAGNVGSMLRSAAAFGVGQVLALKGTATLWSPKVVRAGMGAHFRLSLHEGLEPAALDALRIPLLATSPHAATALTEADLPSPCAWLMGHEGQGIGHELLSRCALNVRIPQRGEESLNVAAAAAVCLYESARRAATPGPPGEQSPRARSC